MVPQSEPINLVLPTGVVFGETLWSLLQASSSLLNLMSLSLVLPVKLPVHLLHSCLPQEPLASSYLLTTKISVVFHNTLR